MSNPFRPKYAKAGKLRNGNNAVYWLIKTVPGLAAAGVKDAAGFCYMGYSTNDPESCIELWRGNGSWSYDGRQHPMDLVTVGA